MMTNLFQTFSGATFAILSGTSQLAYNINHLAAQVPNVAQVGNGKSGFVTDLIAYETALRLQVAPASKTAAFLSHAPSVEWTYGNLQVIRRGLAKALAAIIEDDYIHERQVPDTLRQILNRSPRMIYGLI
jgi:glucuronate isomerase